MRPAGAASRRPVCGDLPACTSRITVLPGTKAGGPAEPQAPYLVGAAPTRNRHASRKTSHRMAMYSHTASQAAAMTLATS